MVKLLAKLFGGRVKSGVASAAVWLTLWFVSQLVKLNPHLAELIDPEKVATFLTAAFFTGINLVTNDTHMKAMEEINAVLQSGVEPAPEIPIKRAGYLE